ncbi:hypothetical protein DFH06DRAFT_1321801 [Mycena polygramma]|nr:hypothetical protein DFH06DRAFT_1321801 [Mycena polygramma]
MEQNGQLNVDIYSPTDNSMAHGGDNYSQYSELAFMQLPQYPLDAMGQNNPMMSNNFYVPSVQDRLVALENKTLPVLSQILGRIGQLERQVVQLTREAEEVKRLTIASMNAFEEYKAAHAQNATEDDQKKALEASAVKTAVIAQIHDVTNGFLGIGIRDETTSKINKKLLHPLGPGETDDTHEHPNWMKGVEDRTNALFVDKVINAVHGTVLEDQKLKEPKLGGTSKAQVAKLVKGYFNTLRTNYIQQTTPTGMAKKEERNLKMKRTARVEDKCDDLRAGLVELRKVYGEENTVGAEEVLVADYLSSEHSDCGQAEPKKFEAHILKMGGGTHGLEVRAKAWHAKETRMLYARLKTFRNVRRKQKNDPSTGEKLSTAGKARIPRFKGMKENINHNPPPTRMDRLPYASMVDSEWKAKMEAQGIMIPVAADPAAFTIFSLDIPMTDLDAEERAYFADDDEMA